MNNKEKIVERLKSVVIVLLLVFTVFLLWHTEYYSNAFRFISGVFTSARDSIQSAENTESIQHSAARIEPLAVSVFMGTGSRYASIYDKENVQADFQKFSAYLAEALGTAGEPAKISDRSWNTALNGENVYFEFMAPVRLDILSYTLGTSMNSEAGSCNSSKMFLGCDGGEVKLYFAAEHDYFCCPTSLPVETLRARLSEFPPNNARFSQEISTLSNFGSAVIIPDTMPDIYMVNHSISASVDEIAGIMTGLLGFNEYSMSEYTEHDGTVVIRDGGDLLRIYADGRVDISLSDLKLDQREADISYLYQLAWDYVGSSIASRSADGDIFPWGITLESDSSIQFYFNYSVNGIPTKLNHGQADAASIVITEQKSGYVLEGSFYFRRFEITQEPVELIPPLQAAAVASANGKRSIQLVYSRSAEGINCIWVS